MFAAATLAAFASCSSPHKREDADLAERDTVVTPIIRYYDLYKVYDELKDENNFAIRFGNAYLDSLHDAYDSDPSVSADTSENICYGDACTRYLLLKNPKTNTVFYFFKTSASEYGFGNDQFVFLRDSLIYIRRFDVSIDDWGNRGETITWKIEEEICRFQDEAVAYTRIAYTTDLYTFDYTLHTIPFTETEEEFKDAYLHWEDAFSELMALKKLVE